MNASLESADRLLDLVDCLIAGFEELVSLVSFQAENEKTLKSRIELAANEYQNLLAADSSRSVSSLAVPPSQVLKQLRRPLNTEHRSESLPSVRKAQQVIEIYKRARMNKPQNNEAKCPVAHRTPDAEDFERDFTTPGVQGNLGCPFARMSNGLPNGLDGQTDPIAAEFHQDKISTTSPVSEQKPGKCPIRFLDKHSPEEIAKYFENHKHEIPRSHEICVRRYQQNESSARQLDAKYGSLVNMIQGLGVKHKAYLPERDRIEEHDRRSSSHAVEKWAENLSEHPPPAKDEDLPSEEAPRVPHFERTLREVRVGESPSRPWGISVPADNEPSPSALQSQDGIEHLKIQPESSSAEADAKPTAGAAADHSEITSQKKPLPRNDPASTTTKEPRTQIIFNGPTFLTFLPEESRTQITYNGPVFLGYSADEVINLLQRTNIVSATTTGANMG